MRDHVCGAGGVSFGVEASKLWSRWMLNAEGPKSFEKGFHRLLEKYADDGPRTTYIRELFADPMKAHFKRRYTFRNGTLVDACEILFSAVKTWVYGKSRKSSSLLMAVIRIVEGSREMILKDYLKHPKGTARATVDKTECWPVVTLFKHCIQHLTAWSVKYMYSKLDRIWLSYDVEPLPDEEGSTTGRIQVTRRNDGDRFVVRRDCTCWYRENRCWQQTYTGLPCKHAVLTTIDRLREASGNKDERVRICETFVSSCHTNWLRSTYRRPNVAIDICKPAPVHKKTIRGESRKEKLMIRFRQVIPFVPHTRVQKLLKKLEEIALEPTRRLESDTESDNETSNEPLSDSGSYESNRTITRPDIINLADKADDTIRFVNPPIDRTRKRKKPDT